MTILIQANVAHISFACICMSSLSQQALINLYRKCRLRSDIASKNRNELQPSFDFDMAHLYCYQPVI